jgi:hypothetical protein
MNQNKTITQKYKYRKRIIIQLTNHVHSQRDQYTIIACSSAYIKLNDESTISSRKMNQRIKSIRKARVQQK